MAQGKTFDDSLFKKLLEAAVNLPPDTKNVTNVSVLDQILTSCCQNGNIFLIPGLLAAGARSETYSWNRESPLMVSVLNNQTNCARMLLAAGADVDCQDRQLNTPLIVCALNNNVTCARVLLKAYASPNICNKKGDTALIISSRNNCAFDFTNLLLVQRGIDIEHTNIKGYSPLMCAIEACNLNAIKLLIDAGAILRKKVKVRGDNKDKKKTYWQWREVADRNGILNVIRFFRMCKKKAGRSPLLLAALKRDLHSAQLLTSLDSLVLNFGRTMIQFLEYFHEKKRVVKQIDLKLLKVMMKYANQEILTQQEKEPVMKAAVSLGNRKIIKLLVKHNYPVSYEILASVISSPPLLKFIFKLNPGITVSSYFSGSYLLEKAIKKELVESLEILHQKGARIDVDDVLPEVISNGREKSLQYILEKYSAEALGCIKKENLLLVAVEHGQVNIIKMLLDHGADVNHVHYNTCPLTAALDINVIELLLSRGADVNLRIGISGSFPLLHVVGNSYKYALQSHRNFWSSLDSNFNASVNTKAENVIKLLLEKGANINMKSDRTALHEAAKINDSSGILYLLLSSGANVNEKNYLGRTALYVAVQACCTENVQCLLIAGADVNIVCEHSGRHAIFEASKAEILALLLQSPVDVNIHDIKKNNALLHALDQGFSDTKCINLLVDAGCDLEHVNAEGHSALTLAAKSTQLELLNCLVSAGAKVNRSDSDEKTSKSAISVLLVKLWRHSQAARKCIDFLLDHDATLTHMNSCVIHVLITSGSLALIPRFIALGLSPCYLTITSKAYAWFEANASISPLALALITNHSNLAQYFIDIKFLTRYDISVLSGNKIIHEHLRSEYSTSSLNVVKANCHQPLPLETLCFIAVSDALGSSLDRKLKVQRTGLPPQLQNLLMFRTDYPYHINDSYETRNFFLFRHCLLQSNLNLKYLEEIEHPYLQSEDEDSDF